MISGGTITTIAGNGTAGYLGDTAAATAAELNSPSGLAFDASGNLYIADTKNNVIRKITNGTITTVAGNNGQPAGNACDNGPATSAGLNGPTGLAFDSAGNMYIPANRNNAIRRVDTPGKVTTFAAASG